MSYRCVCKNKIQSLPHSIHKSNSKVKFSVLKESLSLKDKSEQHCDLRVQYRMIIWKLKSTDLEELNKFVFDKCHVFSGKSMTNKQIRRTLQCPRRRPVNYNMCNKKLQCLPFCVVKINCMEFEASLWIEHGKTHLSVYHCQ